MDVSWLIHKGLWYGNNLITTHFDLFVGDLEQFLTSTSVFCQMFITASNNQTRSTIYQSTHILGLNPPLVQNRLLTRGGFRPNFPFSKSTPKIFGRLRRPKSTFMNLIDSILSLFWISPPQAGKFWGFGLVSHVFLLFFKGKSIKTQPKNVKIFPPAAGNLA